MIRNIDTLSTFNPPYEGDEIELADGRWIVARNAGNWFLHRPGMNQVRNLKVGSFFGLTDFLRAIIENQ